jgi:hypothetical protein
MAMRRRQTVPHQWLIIRDSEDRVGLAAARRLPRGSGVLLLEPLPAREMRRLRLRGLTFVEEQRGSAARVHNLRELRRALTDHTPLILVSPVYAAVILSGNRSRACGLRPWRGSEGANCSRSAEWTRASSRASDR